MNVLNLLLGMELRLTKAMLSDSDVRLGGFPSYGIVHHDLIWDGMLTHNIICNSYVLWTFIEMSGCL